MQNSEIFKIVLVTTCAFMFNLMTVLGQTSIYECIAYCEDYPVYDTIDLTYATYVGPNPEEVKFKYVRHEYSPAKSGWIPVKSRTNRQAIRGKYHGDAYSMVELAPAIFEEVKVVKRPKKYPTSHIAYVHLPTVVEREKEEVECEAICGWENSLDFMMELMTALKHRDYPVEYISVAEILGLKLTAAIEHYQKNHNLRVGKLTRETLNHLGVEVEKYLE